MFTTVFGNIGNFLMKIFGILPIKKNKIVFQSFYGEYYNDNPKYIYEAMRRIEPNYDYVWLMQDRTVKIAGCRVVKSTSVKALYELATAKCWIDNSRKREWCVKRRKQYYVQTWHAGIGLKAAENACADKLSKKYVESAINDSKMANLFLANSDWMESLYKKYFWYNGKILKKGVPREDSLYKKSEEAYKKICSYFDISNDTRIVLYVPTFRDEDSIKAYTMDYKKVLQFLNEKTGNNWKMILRLHPNIKNDDGKIIYNEEILNGTQYKEINDLILACDYLITDYSSCMFDGMIAGKKVLIYASDIEEYEKERGFLFKWNELPFEIASDTAKLIDILSRFDEKNYKNKITSFQRTLGFVSGGSSSKDVANYILEQIK